MNNEKYFNYYVESLTNTMTDAVVRNVSLQASVKIAEEEVKELNQVVELMDAEIGQLKQQLELEKKERNNSENSKIRDLENQVSNLNSQLNEISYMKSEYENVKHQVQHIETFRNELTKSRKENEDLKKQIEYLQLTPAKRKKYDEVNNNKNNVDSTEINNKEQIKDGGSF